MDVEWCIMCDNKIYPNDHSETYSAYCSTHCFLTAHLEASESQNQSRSQTQSTSQSQSQTQSQSSSSKPESKKQPNRYPSSINHYTIKPNYPINSTGSSSSSSSSSSSNLNRNGNLRIDSIYPIHSSNSIGLEESLSNQFLCKPNPHQPQHQNSSQYILSSVYSSISTTNDEDLLDHHQFGNDDEIRGRTRGRGRSADRKGLGNRYLLDQKIWLGEPNFLKS